MTEEERDDLAELVAGVTDPGLRAELQAEAARLDAAGDERGSLLARLLRLSWHVDDDPEFRRRKFRAVAGYWAAVRRPPAAGQVTFK